jgi:hypothetical protein
MLILPLPLRTTLFDPKGHFGQSKKKKTSPSVQLRKLKATPLWMSRHFAPKSKRLSRDSFFMLLLPLLLRTTHFDLKGNFGQPENKIPQVFSLENLKPTPLGKSRHLHQV